MSKERHYLSKQLLWENILCMQNSSLSCISRLNQYKQSICMLQIFFILTSLIENCFRWIRTRCNNSTCSLLFFNISSLMGWISGQLYLFLICFSWLISLNGHNDMMSQIYPNSNNNHGNRPRVFSDYLTNKSQQLFMSHKCLHLQSCIVEQLTW